MILKQTKHDILIYIYIYNFIVSVCKQNSVFPPVTQKLSVVWKENLSTVLLNRPNIL